MKGKTLINDSEYGEALDKLGFCVARLFTIQQVNAIKELYHQFSIENKVSGLIASHSKIGPEKNLQLSNSLKEIVMPALEKNFSDFNFFMGGFMVKEANTPAELPLHQDWNILDESQYTSYQIWIPVDLSSSVNGGMYVLPCSHLFFGNYRSGSYGIPTVTTDETLRPLVTDMIIAPGNALVFHNSLFHASYPNDSNQNRISAIISIYQKNAPLNYYHKNIQDNRTDIYGINSESFLTSLNTLENGGVPEHPLYKKAGPIDEQDNKLIDAAELLQKYNAHLKGTGRNFEPLQRHILKDEEIEKKMARQGYAVIDFLPEQIVADLKDIYLNKFSTPQTASGRFTTMENTSPETRRHFHQLILDKIDVPLKQYFKNYQVPIATYFTKYANSNGDLSWHQDSSLLLNAHLEPHYAIWCPLIDVNENNGALCVIEESHKANTNVTVHDLPWPYLNLADKFEENKTVLKIKAGQAVLFDIRLVHHATPNNTNEDRICFSLRITHQKSDYYNFLCESSDKSSVSVFKETSNHYLRDEWNTGQKPDAGTKIGELHKPHARVNLRNMAIVLEPAL